MNIRIEILKYCQDAHSIAEIFAHIKALDPSYSDKKYKRDVVRQIVYGMRDDGLLWAASDTSRPRYKTTDAGRKYVEAVQP